MKRENAIDPVGVPAQLHARACELPDSGPIRLARPVPVVLSLAAPDRHATRSLEYLIATVRTTTRTRSPLMRLTTLTTFEGNLAYDPELHRAANSDRPYVDLVVLVNDAERSDLTASGDLIPSEPTRHRVRAFGALAENTAASVHRGEAVLVAGRMTTETWTDKTSQEKRTAQRILADAIGPSLRYATAQVERRARGARSTAGPA